MKAIAERFKATMTGWQGTTPIRKHCDCCRGRYFGTT
jgi:hypothetical protein